MTLDLLFFGVNRRLQRIERTTMHGALDSSQRSKRLRSSACGSELLSAVHERQLSPTGQGAAQHWYVLHHGSVRCSQSNLSE